MPDFRDRGGVGGAADSGGGSDDGGDTGGGAAGGDDGTPDGSGGTGGFDAPDRGNLGGGDPTAGTGGDAGVDDDDSDRSGTVTRPDDDGADFRDPRAPGGGPVDPSEPSDEPETEPADDGGGDGAQFEEAGLEEQAGAITGREDGFADAVQRLQGRITRTTPLSGALDTDEFNIVREGDRQLGVEFSDDARDRISEARIEAALQSDSADTASVPSEERIEQAADPADLPGLVSADTERGFRPAPAAQEQQRTAEIQAVAEGLRADVAAETPGVEPSDVDLQVEDGRLIAESPEPAPTGQPASAGVVTDQLRRPDPPAGARDPEAGLAERFESVAATAPQAAESVLSSRFERATAGAGDSSAEADNTGPLTGLARDVTGAPSERELTDRLQDVTGLPSEEELRGSVNEAIADAFGGPEPRAEFESARATAREQTLDTAAAFIERGQQNPLAAAAAVPVALAEPSPLGEAGLLSGAVAGALGVDLASRVRSAEDGEPSASVFETSPVTELDVGDREPGSELEVSEARPGSELETPSGDARTELTVSESLFNSELSAEESATAQSELDLPTGESATDEGGSSRQRETVVPTDFPLAGRDIPADPDQEVISDREVPTAEASPASGLVDPEQEEPEAEDELGVPDDPFRRSDRRLFDPQRTFGEQEDVSRLPEEETPGDIDDIGSGIAGTGTGFEPARGETVAENFEQFLREREEREEQAQRQEVFVERDLPTGAIAEPQAVSSAEANGAAGAQAVAPAARFGANAGAGSTPGLLPLLDPADSRPRGDERLASASRLGQAPDERLDQPPAFDTPLALDPAAANTAQDVQTPTPTAETTVPAQATPTVTQPVLTNPQLNQPEPLQTPTVPELSTPTPPATGPPTSPPPSRLRPRDRTPDDDDDDEPLDSAFGVVANPFSNPVETAEEFLGDSP